jgi:hypothetical protein
MLDMPENLLRRLIYLAHESMQINQRITLTKKNDLKYFRLS